jgi:LemA protein
MMEKASSVVHLVELLLVLMMSIFLVPSCQSYDTLVAKDTTCDQKWADLDANLQRRADLIPNLVSTVKAAANYEQSTLTKITQARADATSIKLSGDDFTDPAKMKAFEEAQSKISAGSLSRLLVSNENYPKLQASQQYTGLMKQLEGTENRILRAREEYNAAVADYNTELGKIRGQVINKATGKPFKKRVFFAASTESQAPPKVSF